MSEELEKYIAEHYKPSFVDDDYMSRFSGTGTSLTHLIPNNLKPDENESFSRVLFKLIDKHGFQKDADVYRDWGVSRQTFSDIRAGKKPSKKTVIQLCFGANLTDTESVDLMNAAGYTFSEGIMFDVIIMYHLKKRQFKDPEREKLEIDEDLHGSGEETLFSKL